VRANLYAVPPVTERLVEIERDHVLFNRPALATVAAEGESETTTAITDRASTGRSTIIEGRLTRPETMC
jgi:hypothetical protein